MPTNTLSLNFTGANFKGSYPANTMKLNFTGSLVNTKKESALNFWGGKAGDVAKSEIKYQIL